MARFELATPCLQGRCNNHYATSAQLCDTHKTCVTGKKFNFLPEVGFEPTPTNRIELKSTALDHSAIQAYYL